jgi:hypothetical protein
MRLDVTLDKVGYAFVKIIIESKTNHVYKKVLLTIQIAAYNSFGTTKFSIA